MHPVKASVLYPYCETMFFATFQVHVQYQNAKRITQLKVKKIQVLQNCWPVEAIRPEARM